jgi:UDP:flavonoid glycosyltransferase YjiC (YdhE family)
MKKHGRRNIAFFVTDHGFGHAARASAVMAALRERDETIGFEIFSTVPQWFFTNSLGHDFGYHPVVTDVGMAQTSPFHADLRLTLERLRQFLPFDKNRIHDLSETVLRADCRLIVCDIAPLGIAVAEQAEIPSLLIENFTWDWIYNGMPPSAALKTSIDYLGNYFKHATYHIQTEPVCEYRQADLLAAPASRKFRTPKKTTRESLGIPDHAHIILLTFGGITNHSDVVSRLHHQKDVCFIISGAFQHIQKTANTIMLPNDDSYFHPDLIQASDAVVGKAGYSTIAEVYYAGIPFGYISKPSFRESPILERFVKQHMTGIPIHEEELTDGLWVKHIPELLDLTSKKPSHANGADQIADFIIACSGKISLY